MFIETCGDDCMSCACVFECNKRFNEGHNVEMMYITIEKNVDKICKIFQENCRFSL